ncbi:MAG TPA: universal stress protein [Kofleriaceae bacterium]|nr:universal stress protein [Kofleriaceae bacterium]
MSSTYSQVVVGFDFSHSGRAALYRAIALATRAPFHVLQFICVIEPHSPIPAVPGSKVDYGYAERVQRAMTDEIELELRAAQSNTRIHFNVHARIGKAADEILDLAREVGADLIIVGSKGLKGVERLVLGSVSEKVVREAGCTVEVARAKTYEHVDLLDVKEVEPHLHYVPPHRYYYEENRLSLRPADWPIP